MIDTLIYISVTRGDETLTLDGKLYLFRELLAILPELARDLSQTDRNLPTEDLNQCEGGMRGTD